MCLLAASCGGVGAAPDPPQVPPAPASRDEPAGRAVTLEAAGTGDAYALINGVLGGNAIESPDCGHTGFGPHITLAHDSALRKSVFVFHAHVDADDDRCRNSDRQRIEIKTYGPSPDYVKAFHGDRTVYRWRFKLDAGFQPSRSFTHIHQLKAGDGDAGAPIITLTPRLGSPEQLELIHVGSDGSSAKVATTELAPFKGTWVEAYETVTWRTHGDYSLEIRRVDDGALLVAFSSSDLDLWRDGTTFARPKWGIYRSLNHRDELRDEQVSFDRFCLAKGIDDCPAGQALATTPTPRDPRAHPWSARIATIGSTRPVRSAGSRLASSDTPTTAAATTR